MIVKVIEKLRVGARKHQRKRGDERKIESHRTTLPTKIDMEKELSARQSSLLLHNRGASGETRLAMAASLYHLISDHCRWIIRGATECIYDGKQVGAWL